MLAIPLMVMAAPAAATETPAQDAILAAMADSAAGWNGGDLDRFVALYADDATYVTARGVVRGRAAIAGHYAASFTSGGNRRGRLSFAVLAWRDLDPRHILLIARWTLTAANGKVESGPTSLIFARERGGWRIVADHSS